MDGPGRCAPDRQRPTDGACSTVTGSRGPLRARPAAAGRCALDRRPRSAARRTARRTGGRRASWTGYCRHEQHRVNLLPHIDPAREGRMGGRGTQGRVRGIGGGGEGATFSLPHSFRQVQLWTFRRMHGPLSASRNTRGRTAVAVRADISVINVDFDDLEHLCFIYYLFYLFYLFCPSGRLVG